MLELSRYFEHGFENFGVITLFSKEQYSMTLCSIYFLLEVFIRCSYFQPFWPTGSGCARGFLSAFDAAWAARAFGLGKEPLDIIHERECILKLLAQTNPGNMLTNYQKYSIDPATR